ncbi:hypothetical protein GCM10023238_29570 [Streptomyces heliomycini]
MPEHEDIDERARRRSSAGCSRAEQGLTLGAAETCDLLGAYGVHVHRALPAPDPDTAAEAAARTLGYPVPSGDRPPPEAPRRPGRRPPGPGRRGTTARAYAELTELFGARWSCAPCAADGPARCRQPSCARSSDPAAGAVLSFGSPGPPRSCSGTWRTG